MRVHTDTVRADKLPWSLALVGIPELTQHLAVQIQNRDAMPKPRRIFIREGSRKFANIEDLVAAAAHVHTAGAIDVVPHGEEFAFGVEDLDAVVFAVGDIDPVLDIRRNIVRDIKLTRRDPRLTPGEEQSAIGRVLVYPRVAVAIGDVDVVGEWRQRHVRVCR